MTGRTYTHPGVFTAGVAEGWAEPETDPARIGWPARQAAAAIPFQVIGGRPVNPCEKTGIEHGRGEMGYWGENLMADALVTVTCAGTRYLLMVERGDGYGWAVPGGHVEPGETGAQAAARELAEETGLRVAPRLCQVMAPRYVPDPRASDEAWAVTIPVHIGLGAPGALPAVHGGDDARRAAWIPARSYHGLAASLRSGYGGKVFAAHAGMLRRFLAGAAPPAQGGDGLAAAQRPGGTAGQDGRAVRAALLEAGPQARAAAGVPAVVAPDDRRPGRRAWAGAGTEGDSPR